MTISGVVFTFGIYFVWFAILFYAVWMCRKVVNKKENTGERK
jgi:hypothetical protein